MSKQSAVVSSVRRETEWRDRLARQTASGLSVRAFCERELVSTWAFYQWRSRLVKRSRKPVATSADGSAAAPFIEVNTVCAAEGSDRVDPRLRKDRRFEIKLDLGDGVVLHLARF
jgi:hypothetical protein